MNFYFTTSLRTQKSTMEWNGIENIYSILIFFSLNAHTIDQQNLLLGFFHKFIAICINMRKNIAICIYKTNSPVHYNIPLLI